MEYTFDILFVYGEERYTARLKRTYGDAPLGKPSNITIFRSFCFSVGEYANGNLNLGEMFVMAGKTLIPLREIKYVEITEIKEEKAE